MGAVCVGGGVGEQVPPKHLARTDLVEMLLGKLRPNKAASERLADLLYLFGDWPGGVGEQGDKGPAWKFSRGLFL